MARQFDVVENLNPVSRSEYPFLLVIQHDRITSIRTTIVAPLTRSVGSFEQTRLHVAVDVADVRYVVLMQELAAVPRSILGKSVGSLESSRYDIIAALDLLFTGI